MTLSDALVLMVPPDRTLSPDEDARRQSAIELAYANLVKLARRVVPEPKRDDVVNDVVVRLMKNRPGPRRYTATDAEATSYLITALKNKLRDSAGRDRDQLRRLVSTTPDEEDGRPRELADPNRDVRSVLIERESRQSQSALLAMADAVLYEQAIPAIACTLREGDGFLANVRDIRAIAREAVTIDDIVAREQRTGDTFVRTRNRIYQRQKRARGYLLEVPRNRPDDVPRLSAWLVRAALDPELESAVRAVANFDFAPRVQHPPSPSGFGAPDGRQAQAVSDDEVVSE
jgi:DNA-directed RNA polymerase specialized sigma24 family protein